MFRKNTHVNGLESRKQRLVSESELNRFHMGNEWQAIAEGGESLVARVKSVSSLASAVTLLVVGVSAFRRSKALSADLKFSRFHALLKGVQLAGSIWLVFRARSR